MSDHVFTVNPLFVDVSNPSQLAPNLFLAGIATARNYALLRELGITAVMTLTRDNPGCGGQGLKARQFWIDDATEMLDPMRVIALFLDQMEAWERDGETILIHCNAGISRTSSFAIAWLMHKRGCNADSDLRGEWSRAEDQVGKVRPIIMPHVLLKRAVLNYFEGIHAG